MPVTDMDSHNTVILWGCKTVVWRQYRDDRCEVQEQGGRGLSHTLEAGTAHGSTFVSYMVFCPPVMCDTVILFVCKIVVRRQQHGKADKGAGRQRHTAHI